MAYTDEEIQQMWDSQQDIAPVAPSPTVTPSNSMYTDAEIEAMWNAQKPSKKETILSSLNLTKDKAVNFYQPRNTFEKIGGAALNAGEGALFGFGDEIGATIGAGADKVRSFFTGEEPLAYKEYLDQNRESQKDFANENPKTALGLNLGGALLTAPLLPSIPKGGGALTNIGKLALEGAGYGALQGAGSSEGDLSQNAKDAGTGALIGGAATGAMGAVAEGAGYISKKAKDLYEGLKKNAYGIGVSDINKAMKEVPEAAIESWTEFKNPLNKAIESFEAAGGGKRGYDPALLLDDIRAQSESLGEKLRSNLNSINQTEIVIPEFKYAEDYIAKKVAGNQKAQAEKIFNKLKESTINNTDGTLLSIHEEKMRLSDQLAGAFGDDSTSQLEKNILKRMYGDLKTTVEKGVTKFGGNGGEIKRINQELGLREGLKSVLKKQFNREEAGNAGDSLTKLLRTTGGAGGGMILGGIYGGSEGGGLSGTLKGAATGLAAGGLVTTPSGRRKLASGIDLLGNKLGGLAAVGAERAAIPAGRAATTGFMQPSKEEPLPQGVTTETLPEIDLSPYFQDTSNITDVTLTPDGMTLNSPEGETDVMTKLMNGVVKVESNGNPRAVSKAGAMGLTQLMPANIKKFGVKDPFDAEQNLQAGTALMQEELQRFNGDMYLALAAFNAGSPRVNRAIERAGTTDWNMVKKFLPRETQEYPDKVLSAMA